MRYSVLALIGLCAAAGAGAADVTHNPYFVEGKTTLQAALKRVPNTRPAKNVILFIGDAMGINSVTAGRIFMDQKNGGTGVGSMLNFETLPYTGFSQTHSSDQYVTDSANGITAITTGVKTVNGAIGVDDKVTRGYCKDSQRSAVPTVFEQAKRLGFAAGVVTTSALTDATPSGAYGHTADRSWQSDADLTEEAAAAGCIDLARQLVEAPADIRLDVALGGGTYLFYPQGGDPVGLRQDGRNLVETWLKQSPHAAYANGDDALARIDARKVDHLLGLFADNNLPSPVDTDWHKNVPTLEAMTRKAIEVLQRNKKGFVLMVESASIDKWHHRNNAYRALTDVGELDKAVKAAREMTDASDTLIIVTADHSQSLTLSGGSIIGKPLLGLAHDGIDYARDGLGNTRTIVTYATGPGESGTEEQPMMTDEMVLNPNFNQPAGVPMKSAQHTGEDVPVYAEGPQAHLVSGSYQASYLYQVMAHALGIDSTPTPKTDK